MGENTKIAWTDDTHNFWRGCTKVSPGCSNCYAEHNVGVKLAGIKWGKGQPRVRSKSFEEPLKWNKKPWVCGCGAFADFAIDANLLLCPSCMEYPHRRRVFSLSLGDWLDPEVPVAWLADMLDVIRRCPNLDFLLLTKRPELWKQRVDSAFLTLKFKDVERAQWVWDWLYDGKSPSNIWLGTTVENQKTADARVEALRKIPAKVRFLSCEPLLSAVDLSKLFNVHYLGTAEHRPAVGIDWVIVGGESGNYARVCNVEWIHGIVQQCKTAKVPVFVKQLGSTPVCCAPQHSGKCPPELDPEGWERLCKAWPLVINHPKGGDMSEWPEELRIQQFPEVVHE